MVVADVRYNICKDKNQPCDTLGLTRTRGMCNFPNSASVNQDNGLMLGMTLAHETGHWSVQLLL